MKTKQKESAAANKKRIEIELHVLTALGEAWVSGYFSALADMGRRPKRSRKAKVS